MALLLRPANHDDLPAITALYAREVRGNTASWEYDAPDPDEMTRRFEAIITRGRPYLVAEFDGRFAGYAYASDYRARAGYRWTVEDSVYVHPDARGHGVGRALLAQLIEDCTALGLRQMIAVIGDSANRGSIALHEALGFRVIGVFEGIGHKHGRWLDSVQMLRALGDGVASPPGFDGEHRHAR